MERGYSTSLLDCSRRGKHGDGSVRRICDLPDSILSHILSFLPTKKAVATSILSQRWKCLWPLTNNLEFHSSDYDGVDRFVESVNYVLLLHNPGLLNRFTLSWVTQCMPFYVNAWITTAIFRNVRKLILSLRISQFPIHIQRRIFSSESLQSLRLFCNMCISQKIVFSLPKLKSLDLESIIFESEETLCKLLGGCPALKYLRLVINMVETKEKCHLDNGIAFRCIISSTSLRRLKLFAYDEVRNDFYESICGVQLDAPSLQHVKLDQISSISIGQTPKFLVEASVQLVEPAYDYEEQDPHKSVVEAFCAFDCVKKLVLNFGVIKAFMSATIEMKSIFNKLTRLEVTKDFIYWIELHHFLRWLGNLEVFIVRAECVGWYDSDEEENLIAAKPNLVPGCLSNSLRLVAIESYHDDEDDFVMISYILEHASVLELMAIPFYGLEKKSEVIQKISKLPRKSPVCEVDFTWDAYQRIYKS